MMNYGDLEKAFNTIHNPRNWFLDKASQIGKSDLSGPAIDHTLLAQYGHVLSASSTDVPAMTTYLVQSPVIDLLRKVSERYPRAHIRPPMNQTSNDQTNARFGIVMKFCTPSNFKIFAAELKILSGITLLIWHSECRIDQYFSSICG